MKKDELIQHLEEIEDLSRLTNENPFKTRAYSKAIKVLRDSDELKSVIESRSFSDLDGIGKGIHTILCQFLDTGSSEVHQTLKAQVHPFLLEAIQIQGLGPKRAHIVVEDLQIHSISELEYACRENRLANHKGLGVKLQDEVLKAVRKKMSLRGVLRLDQAIEWQKSFESKWCDADTCYFAGAIRRRDPIVHDVEILARNTVIARLKQVAEQACNETDLHPNIKWIEVSSEDDIGMALMGKSLLCKTESGQTQSKNATSTKASSLSIGEKAAFDIQADTDLFDSDKMATEIEKTYTGRHKIEFVPSVLRNGSVSNASDWGNGNSKSNSKNNLESNSLDVVRMKDIKGLFHMHSTESDGHNSINEMLSEAARLGYSYIGLTEHSVSSFYANGLTVERLKKQKKDIHEIQKKWPELKIFWGIECDIKSDGTLDYEDEVLKEFDFVIASVHQRFKMPKDEMTDRIVKAIKNPFTTMIGHLTGRILLGRDGYELDFEEVVKQAAKHKVIIELNAHPSRLDIDLELAPLMHKYGCMTSINPDAHSIEGLSDTRYGVWMAQKALYGPDQVLNTMDTAGIEKWFRDRQ